MIFFQYMFFFSPASLVCFGTCQMLRPYWTSNTHQSNIQWMPVMCKLNASRVGCKNLQDRVFFHAFPNICWVWWRKKKFKKRVSNLEREMLTRVVISFFETHAFLWAKTFTLCDNTSKYTRKFQATLYNSIVEEPQLSC